MITMEEFYRVQKTIRHRKQVRSHPHQFAYAGLMECGHCGCVVVGDLKHKTLAGGEKRAYHYYYCSNGRRNCTRKVITEGEVDHQVLSLLEAIRIPAEARALGEEVIREWQARESHLQRDEEGSLNRQLEEWERKREKLLDMKLNDLLSDAEYSEQKSRMIEGISQMREGVQKLRDQQAGLWDNIENTIALATYGETFFAGGEPAMRALIARTLGARYVLTNKRLSVQMSPVFTPLCELKNAADIGFGSHLSSDVSHLRPVWWDILDETRNALFAGNTFVPSLMSLVEGAYPNIKPIYSY